MLDFVVGTDGRILSGSGMEGRETKKARVETSNEEAVGEFAAMRMETDSESEGRRKERGNTENLIEQL